MKKDNKSDSVAKWEGIILFFFAFALLFAAISYFSSLFGGSSLPTPGRGIEITLSQTKILF